MNYRMITYTLGRILTIEAAFLLLPTIVAVLYGEPLFPFLLTMAIAAALGIALAPRKPHDTTLYARDGFAVVALAWIMMSALGALPFVLSGDIPRYVDALFETVSGFTTTGSTILTDVESLSYSTLFWRSFTHWIGGMGVLVFVMAVLPMSDGHGMHLLRAEMAGPTAGKLVSRMSDTAKILYAIYLALTVILIVLLRLGGMPWFDSFLHAFGTAGTGGFSNRAASIGYYQSSYLEIVTGVGMLLFGINFNLYYFLLIRRAKEMFRSSELRVYLCIIGTSVTAIAINIFHLYQSAGTSLRHAFFQVTSILSTTGYSTVDFNQWPTFSKAILVALMFIGGCAGSTAGGFKVIRVMTLCKTVWSDMKKMLHPHAVSLVRLEGKSLTDRHVRNIQTYLSVYLLVLFGSFLLLSLEPFDTTTIFTAVITCVNNIGPGLGDIIGPVGSFADFSVAGKLLLSFDMLLGRLEIFPMLLLFAPSVWKRRTHVVSRRTDAD